MLNPTLSQAEADVFIARHSYREQLIKFVTMAQSVIENHYQTMNFHTNPPTLKIESGIRYDKITRNGPAERSAFCFVDKGSGDVLKAASWMSPAKGARSNIWDDDLGRSGITAYGGRYLK